MPWNPRCPGTDRSATPRRRRRGCRRCRCTRASPTALPDPHAHRGRPLVDAHGPHVAADRRRHRPDRVGVPECASGTARPAPDRRARCRTALSAGRVRTGSARPGRATRPCRAGAGRFRRRPPRHRPQAVQLAQLLLQGHGGDQLLDTRDAVGPEPVLGTCPASRGVGGHVLGHFPPTPISPWTRARPATRNPAYPPSDRPTGQADWPPPATRHLLDLGHRSIAVVTDPEDMLCSLARLDGQALGVQVPEGLRSRVRRHPARPVVRPGADHRPPAAGGDGRGGRPDAAAAAARTRAPAPHGPLRRPPGCPS